MPDILNAIASPTLPKFEAKLESEEHLAAMKELREAAKEKKAFKEFEQMFVHLLLKEMRKSVNDSSLTTKSHAEKMYEQMMDETLAAQIAESGQLGIGRQLQESVRAERIRQEIQAAEKSMTKGSLEQIKVSITSDDK